MKWRLSIRAAAERDLAEAGQWYELQRRGLSSDFLAAVAATLLRLEANPESQALYYRGFRRMMVTRFPYKIFYRIEGDAVIVFRVLHAARDHTRQLS